MIAENILAMSKAIAKPFRHADLAGIAIRYSRKHSGLQTRYYLTFLDFRISKMHDPVDILAALTEDTDA